MTGQKFTYEPWKWENRIEFQFLPRKTFWGKRVETAHDPYEWFEKCKKSGLADVKMMMPAKRQDRKILGFANTSRSSIVTFLNDGQVRYWTGQWEFDKTLKLWNILYTESEWKDAPKGKPAFVDNTKEFLDILEKIEEFAVMIGAGSFAKVFQTAASVLRKEQEPPKNENYLPELPIPKENKALFHAASMADVFGAMGSWNDSPPYLAHEKGLEEEYDTLSDELLTQIRLATLYAVNEWERPLC